MISESLIALRATIVTLVLTGIAYPLVVTGLAQLIARDSANGSLVADKDGKVVGSELIGQAFSNPAYFQPRPSAAGDNGYDAMASGGSNLSATSQKLHDRAQGDLAGSTGSDGKKIDGLLAKNPDAARTVPAELLTTSASGLDPHISPAAARWQVKRIAKARGKDESRIEAIIDSQTEGRTFGLLGEPRVNVLLLNMELDKYFGQPK